MSEEREHRTLAPPNLTSSVDAHTPPETLRLTEQAAIAKARLTWLDLIIKSFLGGVFISLGAAFDLVVAGGSPGLRTSNPALATLLGGFCFPVGFVIIILFNVELCTSNMFVMAYSTLRRRTAMYDLARNWIVSYIFNIAGCLFYAGVLCYWSDTLSTDPQKSYAATQANSRVNVNWGYNVTRGIMCNWLVGIAFFFATEGRDLFSKILGIWIAIWTFVAMGYQHSIANYLLVPIGMFYGADFGVGKFIWASCIPVTIGNIIGGAFFGAFAMWAVYGRHEQSVRDLEMDKKEINGV
ncbi:Formate/nitrite transporter [Pyrenochaeta sp. MPI-SDFR-AT-0127]|nr:Formate/nitrite transporter [Pyrenochaeta sp. MPI-SDFR-AT-0127]